jgi:hypothetical protein
MPRERHANLRQRAIQWRQPQLTLNRRRKDQNDIPVDVAAVEAWHPTLAILSPVARGAAEFPLRQALREERPVVRVAQRYQVVGVSDTLHLSQMPKVPGMAPVEKNGRLRALNNSGFVNDSSLGAA